jgi:glycosyltransferase involved in cell wall biosynthesis
MLIEAFACAIPVIGSDSGEIPDVIADAGLVAREGDEQAWISALERLLTEPDARREFGARGLERATKVYAWPQVARGYLDFFEELRARKSRG